MIRLALTTLRFRAGASAAMLVAVLIGTALLVASGGLFETAIRLNADAQRLGGAPIVVTGPAGFKLPGQGGQRAAYAERSRVDPAVAARLAGTPGVAAAVPDVSFAAVPVVDGRPARDAVLAGHDWASASLTPYALRGGAEPSGPGQVVVDAATARRLSVRPGGRIRIAVAGVPETFTVTGVAVPARHVDAPAYFFSGADVRRFLPQGAQADAIGIRLRPGARVDDVAAAVSARLPSELKVRTGSDRGAAEFTGIDGARLPLILLAAIFGGMVLVVMALVVSATISLSVRQRRRELALLRASGATPRQVHRMVVAETMIVAVLAVVAGLALGRQAGDWIFAATTGQGAIPAALDFQSGILPPAAAALAALLSAGIAAGFAARPAARTRPIQAIAEAALPPVAVTPIRRLLAAVFAAGTVALAVTTIFMGPETASAVGGPAVLTGSIAVALFGPELLHLLAGRTADLVERAGGYLGALAAINLRARAGQFAAVLTPVTLGVAIALGNVYSATTTQHAAEDGYLHQFKADVVVTSSVGGVAPALVDRISRTDGVAAASALVTSHGWIEQPYDGKGTDPSTLFGVGSQDTEPVLTAPVASGTMRNFTGDVAALPEPTARRLHISVGRQIVMRLGDGARTPVRVVALLRDSSDYAGVVLPVGLLAAHTTAALPTHVLVRAEPGHDASSVRKAVQAQVGAWPGVTVGDDGVLASTVEQGLDIQSWINYLIAFLAIAYAAIAAINTLAVAVLSRRRELAAQRLAGATRRQVRGMLLIESTVLAGISLVLGTVIAGFTVLPMAIASGSLLPSGPVGVFLGVTAAVFLIVVPVTALAARTVLRPRAVDVIASGAA
ncbi:FtsX-like permease family protein [Actinoallomurus iriomotensis]|uniref:ABC transporter permease n=1 Tax=Actinoallomurus iriomotensis TaxID=478107 RepID=A0A9W6RNP3_9ACTN|nr:FtsX-like permease family protein [Actinoallomurus iriomotensis]GLY78525.1 ABC transporter permease [Actinoallomurus iriomotensis]